MNRPIRFIEIYLDGVHLHFDLCSVLVFRIFNIKFDILECHRGLMHEIVLDENWLDVYR